MSTPGITDEMVRVAGDALLASIGSSADGMRAALAAVVPMIRAQAFEEAAAAIRARSNNKRAQYEHVPADAWSNGWAEGALCAEDEVRALAAKEPTK